MTDTWLFVGGGGKIVVARDKALRIIMPINSTVLETFGGIHPNVCH